MEESGAMSPPIRKWDWVGTEAMEMDYALLYQGTQRVFECVRRDAGGREKRNQDDF